MLRSLSADFEDPDGSHRQGSDLAASYPGLPETRASLRFLVTELLFINCLVSTAFSMYLRGTISAFRLWLCGRGLLHVLARHHFCIAPLVLCGRGLAIVMAFYTTVVYMYLCINLLLALCGLLRVRGRRRFCIVPLALCVRDLLHVLARRNVCIVSWLALCGRGP